MPLINKSSSIPYYQQLADLLRNEIRANQPAGGGIFALPSENELAAQHGITRATVRHALEMLEQDRLPRKIRALLPTLCEGSFLS